MIFIVTYCNRCPTAAENQYNLHILIIIIPIIIIIIYDTNMTCDWSCPTVYYAFHILILLISNYLFTLDAL